MAEKPQSTFGTITYRFKASTANGKAASKNQVKVSDLPGTKGQQSSQELDQAVREDLESWLPAYHQTGPSFDYRGKVEKFEGREKQ